MKSTPRRGRRAQLVTAAVASLLILPLSTSIATVGHAAENDRTPETRSTGASAFHIVQFKDAPVATYAGGVPGYTRTQPQAGARIDSQASAVRAYSQRLESIQDSVLRRVGATPVADRHYTTVLNGVAAKLTDEQVSALEKSPEVAKVWRSGIRYAQTNRTPEFLGLSGDKGVWNSKFKGAAEAGRGVIIGVLDSGIWPEHPSFAPLKDTPDQAIIDAKWKGSCQEGTEGVPVKCNNKLIGAQYFDKAFDDVKPDWRSPRGHSSHGTHVASTAAGAHGVQAVNNGTSYGDVSGVAPAARIAAYKALWVHGDSASGDLIDIIAGIEAATHDGVDILNYSVSSTRDGVANLEQQAFFNAAAAGVFISSSAGNSGDTYGVGSTQNNVPWVTSVAASTSDRPNARTATLGDGVTVKGVGFGGELASQPLIYGKDAGLPGADPDKAAKCFHDEDDSAANGVVPVLDPAKVQGKIVVCDRGIIARVSKSLAVKNAGGVGMIQTNLDPAQSLNADLHSVPTVHVDATEGAKVKSYLEAAKESATAALHATSTEPTRAPMMAGFSSYGPGQATHGDMLKPDITAPGVDIMAGVSQIEPTDSLFDMMSGTSMAAPHVSGLAALIKATHMDWSPMKIKSAIMTTATVKDNQGLPIQRGKGDATPLDFGAGHIRVAQALNPGLVYENTPVEWTAWQCAVGQLQVIKGADACPTNGPSTTDLNYPTIASGTVAGPFTTTRTVTNVTSQWQEFRATLEQPAGYSVSVTPSTMFIAPGQSRTFTFKAKKTTAANGDWAFGALTWKSQKGGLEVRSTIALRAGDLRLPHTLPVGKGTAGTLWQQVTPSASGKAEVKLMGLAKSTVQTVTIPHKKAATFEIVVPEGAKGIGVSLDPSLVAPYDQVVVNDSYSITITKDKKVVKAPVDADVNWWYQYLLNPEPGTYTVEIGHEARDTQAKDVPIHLYLVTDQNKGNATLAAATTLATAGKAIDTRVVWKDLADKGQYMGLVGVKVAGKDMGVSPFFVDTTRK